MKKKEELAKSIIHIIQEGYAQTLINLLELEVDLKEAIDIVNEEDPSTNDMIEEVANDTIYTAMFKALVNDGWYDVCDALKRITDGDCIWIGNDYCDAYENIGRYYGELLFESYGEKINETFERYFDYEAYGRDISDEIEWYETDDGVFEVI